MIVLGSKPLLIELYNAIFVDFINSQSYSKACQLVDKILDQNKEYEIYRNGLIFNIEYNIFT